MQHIMRTATRYNGSGIDSYIDNVQAAMEPFQDDVRAMGRNHGRTTNPAAYTQHKNTFPGNSEGLLHFNESPARLDQRHRLRNRVRSFWAGIPNIILEMADSLSRQYDGGVRRLVPPMIIVGDPKFNPSMKGKRSVAPKKLINYLKRFFLVIIVNEYLSSQKCPKCCSQLTQFEPSSYRRWQCGSCTMARNQQQVPLIVNKDVSAGLNFFKIVVTTLATGRRPAVFSPPTQ
jgi:ribosomal protein S27AE